MTPALTYSYERSYERQLLTLEFEYFYPSLYESQLLIPYIWFCLTTHYILLHFNYIIVSSFNSTQHLTLLFFKPSSNTTYSFTYFFSLLLTQHFPSLLFQDLFKHNIFHFSVSSLVHLRYYSTFYDRLWDQSLLLWPVKYNGSKNKINHIGMYLVININHDTANFLHLWRESSDIDPVMGVSDLNEKYDIKWNLLIN